MKFRITLAIALLGLVWGVHSQRGVRIGYVDMEYILENVEEYREATEQLNNRVAQWKSEIEGRERAIEQQREELEAERVLLTDELIAEREEEIDILEKELIDYQQDRFGPGGDLVLQKQRLIQPIQDQVFSEVQKIGANKRYDFIFDKSADVVMLYSEKRHDISDLVLRAIARTRKVSKPAPKRKARLEDFEGETEEPVSEALQERQQRAQEAEATRIKQAEDRREEQLRLREERKKAYEERRKKLLEEREARRKAKEEERKKATEKKQDTITGN